MKSIAFHTLGCKLNYSETSAIARQFEKDGFEVVDFENAADVYVVNTCSVTDHADRKTKHVVKNALHRNSLANIVVIGCYAQLKPEEIIKIPGVNLVLGAAEKFNIVSHVQNLYRGCEPAIFNSHIKDIQIFNPAYSVGDRTRSFLKVQDGCNYFCAFCTIPLARGRSRSGTINSVLRSAEEIAAKGIKEIVLTGVNIGDFQNDNGEDFLKLIQALDEVEGIERFRISSIEPNLLSEEIITYVAGANKIAPHFHIPLQSGSDKILELMRRRYNSSLYAGRIELIKKLIPDCCIGVDVIAGFPGETEEDFRETFDFLHGLPVSYLHVFTYSERPNTTALRLPGKVPHAIRSERNQILTSLSNKKRRIFYEDNLGKEYPVLWEQQKHGEQMEGFTSNYIKVKTKYDPAKVNTVEVVELEEIDPNGMVMAKAVEFVRL